MKETTSPTCQQAIGASIRAKRADQGFTQESLSEVTGIPQPTVSMIETGGFTLLNLDLLHRICLATNTPPSEFLGSLDAHFRSRPDRPSARRPRPRRLRTVARQVAS